MRAVAIVLLALLTVPACCMAADTSGVADVIAGKAAPLTLKLKNLDSSYMRFLSYGYGRGGSWLATASSYGAGGVPFYTRGDTVTIGGEKYLIAYSVQAKGPNYSGMMMYGRVKPDMPEPQKITADADLAVSLFNLRSLSPMSDVRRFDLTEEIATYDQYLQDFKEMMASRRAEMSPSPGEGDNLAKLAAAVDMYAADHDGVLPNTTNMDAFRKDTEEYVDSPDTFTDPESGQPYGLNPSLAGKSVKTIQDRPSTIVLYQPKPGSDGRRGAAFADGSSRRLTEDQWNDLKAKSGIQ